MMIALKRLIDVDNEKLEGLAKASKHKPEN